MDANGTRFHLLLGRDDWAKCTVGGRALSEIWDSSEVISITPDSAPGAPAWNDERDELTLQTRLFKFIAAPKDTFPDLINRRGAGRDRYHNWYWIDESRFKIRVNSSGTMLSSDFWPTESSDASQHGSSCGDFQPRDAEPTLARVEYSGLAVTEDHYLVVGVLEPAGLLIFDLHAGGEPRQVLWPKGIEFEPFDMAPMPGGGVWILDRVHRCYWALDRYFNVISHEQTTTTLAEARQDDFQPVAQTGARGTPRRTFPHSISLNASSPLNLNDPISIEALPDCTVLILDNDPDQDFSSIYRFQFEEQLGHSVSTNVMSSLIEEDQASNFSLRGYDIAFVPAHEGPEGNVFDRLYVVSADGNQTYAFNLSQHRRQIEMQPVAEYLPMRLFGGKGLVAAGTNVYYDFADGWIPLVQQKRPRYIEEATLQTEQFDGHEPDCVWHRLMIDACIPPETGVEVWSRAANDQRELELTDWQAEPRLYLRGDNSELPFMPRRSSSSSNGQTQLMLKKVDGTWELLFQRARGRYLQLKLKLTGNERMSPRVQALRAYYPRFSYLAHYMPSLYREDVSSSSFLDRFLANLEGFYTPLEDRVAAVQMLFDVRSAPAETLEWLASWFGVALDPAWDEAKRRMFIRHAMDFFQYRGTIHGLRMALRLALDPCADQMIFELPSASTARPHGVRIVEKYLTRRTPGVMFGDPTDLMGPREISNAPQWLPEQGRTDLSQRYTDFINLSATEEQPFTLFPIRAPVDAVEAGVWTEFSRATLRFIPSASAPEKSLWEAFLTGRYGGIQALNTAYQTSYDSFASVPMPTDMPTDAVQLEDWQLFVLDAQPARTPVERKLWQDFLARRYRRITALNQAYATHWDSFSLVALPDELPRDGAPLVDWYQFESVVMAMQGKAHRFSVLLPMPKSATFSLEDHQRLLDLSRRIINLEKPAHTTFDVKFYWALFRLGEARLGEDTLIDRGSRAPQLMPKLILGQGFVGESYLAPAPPQDAHDRYITGRDQLVQ